MRSSVVTRRPVSCPPGVTPRGASVGVWQAASITATLAPRGGARRRPGDWLRTFTHETRSGRCRACPRSPPAQLQPGALDDRCASSWRRPTRWGTTTSGALVAEDGLRGAARQGARRRCRSRRAGGRRRPRRRPGCGARKQYACVMHIHSERCRQGPVRLCAPTHCGTTASGKVTDEPSPSPATARRRPPVPHRRWPRDHVDLPPRARPAVLRRLRPAQGRRRARGAADLLRARTSPSRASAASASSWTPRRGARTPTGRARLGYGLDDLDAANRRAVALAEEIRAAGEAEATPIVINGVIGPRGDGYDPGELMCADEAQRYHARQIATLRRQRRRHGHRRHHDQPRRGDRHRPRRARPRPAGGDLLHAGDRRAPARRPAR